MIAIIDYGVGNLFSLSSSLTFIGAQSVITSDPQVIKKADRVILPGVGAFIDARNRLSKTGLDKIVIEKAQQGTPLLGVCLGMQLLLEKSYEYGCHDGLGLIPGNVKLIETEQNIKIPHIGWNALSFSADEPLFSGIKKGDYVYFVHSYHATDCEKYVIAKTEYGINVTAAIRRDNVMGTQFHPEKSGTVGLNILKSFAQM